MAKSTDRRKFIRRLATGAAGVATMPSVLARATAGKTLRRGKRTPANDRVRLALVGAGGMGFQDTFSALEVPGTEIAAVCDLYTGNIEKAKATWGKDIFTTRDHREIMAREDIDAVIVATPDHWHQEISIDALNTGKAVYCEKPMLHAIGEGADLIAAQEKSGKTFQVGSQGMSSLGNEKARELYRSGAIGQLVYAEGFWARNSPIGAWQYPIPADASLKTVDWDRFIYNTTRRSYDPMRFFRWRNYKDYGTGVSGDLFVHLFSSLHFITDSMGPTKVQATGGLRYWKDGREVPDVLLGMFDYPATQSHPAFNLSLRVNFVDGTSGSTYLRLVGSEGAMDVEWEKVTLRRNKAHDPMDAYAISKAEPVEQDAYTREMNRKAEPEIFVAESGYKGAHYDHVANFIAGVREGTPVAQDVHFGFRAAVPALLCNDSYFGQRIMFWDPVKMEVVER